LRCGASLARVSDCAEHGCAADRLQRSLRSRFQRRLTPSVDMTSNVKSWRENSHDVFCMLRSSLVMWCIGRAGASKTRRLIMLISVGWLPPYLYPSGACLNLGTRVPCGLITPPRVTPHRGCVSSDRGWQPLMCASTRRPLYAFGDPATCLAMAHMKALNSRAMATTT
jgi:hypothetical protein